VVRIAGSPSRCSQTITAFAGRYNSSFAGSRGLNERINYLPVGLYISPLRCAKDSMRSMITIRVEHDYR
jgi:hypothetical protein